MYERISPKAVDKQKSYLLHVLVGSWVLAFTLISAPLLLAGDDKRPFWAEKSTYIEGDDLFVVGVASKAKSVEEGRRQAFENGKIELMNFAQVTNLEAQGLVVETQMTYEEPNSDGTVNVFRLLRVPATKLVAIQGRLQTQSRAQEQTLEQTRRQLAAVQHSLTAMQQDLESRTRTTEGTLQAVSQLQVMLGEKAQKLEERQRQVEQLLQQLSEIEMVKRHEAEAKNNQEKDQAANRISGEERKYLARNYYEQAKDLRANPPGSGNNIPLLNEAIRLDPNLVDAWIERGFFYQIVTHDYQAAIEDADEAIRLDPNNIRAYVLRGSTYYKKGEYAQAINDYTAAINLPGNEPATEEFESKALQYMNRGFAHEKLKQEIEALVDFRLALGFIYFVHKAAPESFASQVLKPIEAIIYFQMARIYSARRVLDKALENYEKACALDKELYKALCHLREGR